MFSAWIEWGLRRPHVVVIPALMVLMFLCLALAPITGWPGRPASMAVYLGTPPVLAPGPESAVVPSVGVALPNIVVDSTGWSGPVARRTGESGGAPIGTVTYYEQALPTTMNPLYGSTMVDHRTHELMFDRLFYRSPITNAVTSRVVEDVVADVDSGGLLVTLWDDILWHDGESLTADDVCFTIDTMLDPSTVSASTALYREALSGCEVSADGRSASIRFVRPLYNPFDHLGFWVLPHHVFNRDVVSPDHDFSHRPIGTGPMRGWKGTRDVRLVAVPNAHQDPRIAIVNQRLGGDLYVQYRTLMASGVQGIIMVPPSFRPEILASEEVVLKSYDLRSWWFVAANTSRGPLRSKKIRQAVDAALDRSELRMLTIGYLENDPNPPCGFISGPFVQSSPYYNRAIRPKATADRERVELLMTDAGARKNGGIWTLDGTPITLRVGMKASLDAEARDLLNQLGNQLQGASFDVDVQQISDDDWASHAVTGGLVDDYDLLIGKWSFGQTEDVSSLFHTRTTAGEGANNLFNYSDSAVDALLDQHHEARTDVEAQQAYHALHARLADELPYVFLWKLDTKSAWRNEARANTISPYYYFTNFDDWRYDG
ncbi:MAG: peptide/nickel transport system substrate-binding protein [Myxococcota bacterium]